MRIPEPISTAMDALQGALQNQADENARARKIAGNSETLRQRITQITRSLLRKGELDAKTLEKAARQRQQDKETLELQEALLEGLKQDDSIESDIKAKKELVRTAWESYRASRIDGAYKQIETANDRYNEEVGDAFATGSAFNETGLFFIQRRTVLSSRGQPGGSIPNAFEPNGKRWQSTIDEINKLQNAVMAALKD